MNRGTVLTATISRLTTCRGVYGALFLCWVINVFVIVADIALLRIEHISFVGIHDRYTQHLILFLICTSIVGWAMSRVPALSGVGRRAAWFFHIVVMNLIFGISGIVLTYLVAAAHLPLIDGVLHQVDLALGFHWHAFSRWVESRPILDWALGWAYDSLEIQPILVVFLLVAEDEERQAIDFSLAAMICALMTTAIFVALPALGYPGKIGRWHIIALMHARRHELAAISVGTMTGIVTFPSFHAAMGVIIAYTMRTRLWRAACFIPLNAMLIAATPTVGGHYLIDTIAGCALAAGVLYAVAKWSPGSRGAADPARRTA